MSLIIRDLTVKLQKEEILHHVNLQIEQGEFISLLGASGCGKSTLLKSVSGLLEIESGDIVIYGKPVTFVPPEKRGTVIVFQDLRLFPHMTVEKNIAFSMELRKIPKDEQKKIVKKLLEEVQLSGYEHRKIREMSGGQLQRVALARAFAAQPRVLLLDEPFSGLDEKLRMEMGNLVRKLHEENQVTTILVTHDKREALQMSDRIALMQDGNILQYDTPKNIFYRPQSKSVAEYFGKVNYINGSVKSHVFYSDGGSVEFEVDCEDGSYEAMIRPFQITPIIPKGNGTSRIKDITFMGDTVEILADTLDGEIVMLGMGHELEATNLKKNMKIAMEVKQNAISYLQVKRRKDTDETYCI
ncbi:ABC transporter ATP-binding protein [Lachnospiraceae bacterium LCP25S3_G4]